MLKALENCLGTFEKLGELPGTLCGIYFRMVLGVQVYVRESKRQFTLLILVTFILSVQS